jgi:hypothetical protein
VTFRIAVLRRSAAANDPGRYTPSLFGSTTWTRHLGYRSPAPRKAATNPDNDATRRANGAGPTAHRARPGDQDDVLVPFSTHLHELVELEERHDALVIGIFLDRSGFREGRYWTSPTGPRGNRRIH